MEKDGWSAGQTSIYYPESFFPSAYYRQALEKK